MPVRLRFAMHGTSKNRIFHIVAAHSRRARNSQPIELLGVFDPRLPPPTKTIIDSTRRTTNTAGDWKEFAPNPLESSGTELWENLQNSAAQPVTYADEAEEDRVAVQAKPKEMSPRQKKKREELRARVDAELVQDEDDMVYIRTPRPAVMREMSTAQKVDWIDYQGRVARAEVRRQDAVEARMMQILEGSDETGVDKAEEEEEEVASRYPTGPGTPAKTVQWSIDRIRYWLSVGAKPTSSVARLLEVGGILSEGSPYRVSPRIAPAYESLVPRASRTPKRIKTPGMFIHEPKTTCPRCNLVGHDLRDCVAPITRSPLQSYTDWYKARVSPAGRRKAWAATEQRHKAYLLSAERLAAKGYVLPAKYSAGDVLPDKYRRNAIEYDDENEKDKLTN